MDPEADQGRVWEGVRGDVDEKRFGVPDGDNAEQRVDQVEAAVLSSAHHCSRSELAILESGNSNSNSSGQRHGVRLVPESEVRVHCSFLCVRMLHPPPRTHTHNNTD